MKCAADGTCAPHPCIAAGIIPGMEHIVFHNYRSWMHTPFACNNFSRDQFASFFLSGLAITQAQPVMSKCGAKKGTSYTPMRFDRYSEIPKHSIAFPNSLQSDRA